MQTANGSLVITNAHTATPEVFWNGMKVANVKAIKVSNDGLINKVQLQIKGEGALAEMANAGIEIKVTA